VHRLTPTLNKRYEQWQLWHSNPANLALDPKTQFLNACAKVAEKLTPLGFKAIQKGKVFKKTAQDKDLSFAITFEEGRYNSQTEVKMPIFMLFKDSKKAAVFWLKMAQSFLSFLKLSFIRCLI
jgi:hypothetical protein